MNTNKVASVTNGRQKPASKPRKTRKGKPRTKRITARIDPDVWASKPNGKSWADYITHLARRGSSKGIHDFDVLRNIVWGCQLLDKIVQRLTPHPAEETRPTAGDSNHRLQDVTAILAEVAEVRRTLESL